MRGFSSIDLSSGQSFTEDGVTLTVLNGSVYGMGGTWSAADDDAFKFSTSSGNFTRIEITGDIMGLNGSGWEQTGPGAVWTGEANETTFGGYFEGAKQIVFTIAEPEPTPADQEITPNVDPDHAGVYYSTFFDSANKYALPAGVEAYVATRDGANLLLSKIADAGQTIPADNAVILKSSVTPFTLSISDAEAIPVNAINHLEGSDESIATPANCYVLAGNDGVGFYHYTVSMLNPHKAYVIYSGSQAPRRMPFIFEQATGVEEVGSETVNTVRSEKILRNGQLYIIKNGVKYNAIGQMVK